MEHFYSYHKQLGKELTVSAVMKKKIRNLETDIYKNDEKNMR